MLVHAICSLAAAQRPPIHYFHSADQPPGTVGQGQLLRFPHLSGYFQPVQIQVPRGVRVSLNVEGQFDTARPGPVLAGMQVGQVYPLKISSIPFHEGLEVFPTIELINRIYPPSGQELHFPVPVQINQEELELALSGRFITRVVYLENPNTALPYRDEPNQQRHFDAAPDQDPLRIADRLGRPIAILRMGSRIPGLGGSSIADTPPVILYQAPETRETAPVRGAVERHAQVYRRYQRRPAPRTPVFSAGLPSRP